MSILSRTKKVFLRPSPYLMSWDKEHLQLKDPYFTRLEFKKNN